MRTNFSNLLKPALILAVVSGCLFFTSCKKYVEIEQYASIHNYCNKQYFVGTEVWVRDGDGTVISLESWEQVDVNESQVKIYQKLQMDSALKVKSKIEACLNNR